MKLSEKVLIKIKNAASSQQLKNLKTKAQLSSFQQQHLALQADSLGSTRNKFSNCKAPLPAVSITLVENPRASSQISTPRDDFTPYMHCMLSPRDGSSVASPQGEVLNSANSRDTAGNKIKAVSFGQSRCTSSQKASDMLMNASLAGHQGIMTFGNFAPLLQNAQRADQTLKHPFLAQNSPRIKIDE